MSAHPLPRRRSWLSALVAQLSDYVFEDIEDGAEPEPASLELHPVIAVMSAAPRSGSTTVARLLAAELAVRSGGAAVVACRAATRRGAPGSRAVMRVATAMTGAATTTACGRLCLAAGPPATVAAAARYLAPVVLDVPPDGSSAEVARVADRVVVVAGAASEPALLDAVASVLGGDAIKVVNRVSEPGAWADRGALQIPDSRLAARAAQIGTRALGPLGDAIGALADAVEAPR